MATFTDTSLFKAINEGDEAQVKSLLEKLNQNEINQLNDKGETYLHYALQKHLKLPIIEELIPKINLSQRDIDGNNVMDLVLKVGQLCMRTLNAIN